MCSQYTFLKYLQLVNRLCYCGLVIGIWRAFMVSWICLAHSGMSSVWCPYGMVSWLTLCPFCLWNHCSRTTTRHHHSVPKICVPYSLFNPIVSSSLSCDLYKVFSQQKKSQNLILWTFGHTLSIFFFLTISAFYHQLFAWNWNFQKLSTSAYLLKKQKYHCITSVSLKNDIVINSINNIHYTAWLYSMKLKFPCNKIYTWVE